jgi:hypothetical protein
MQTYGCVRWGYEIVEMPDRLIRTLRRLTSGSVVLGTESVWFTDVEEFLRVGPTLPTAILHEGQVTPAVPTSLFIEAIRGGRIGRF